jgi:hypothetical protein
VRDDGGTGPLTRGSGRMGSKDPAGISSRTPISVMNRDVSLYGIIADLRREHPTPAATETLDMVVAELGRTRDNLKEAMAVLSSKPLPAGGKQVLDELGERAREADVYDLDYGKDPYDKPPVEQLDEGTAGIGALLALTSLAGLALAIVAVIAGVNAILSTS